MANSERDSWADDLARAQESLRIAHDALAELVAYQQAAAAKIASFLRVQDGIHLDREAIESTITRPYTIIPINEHEATMIHWRGIQMPMFGWVIKEEPAFTISRVSRGMNLLTPLPDWARQELGWHAPEHAATVSSDRSIVQLNGGDAGTFKHKYGKHLAGNLGEGKFKIKGGDAWIRLISELIRDGILPYTATPVAKSDWDSKATTSIELRDYQARFTDDFREKGAIFLNLPPGAGKTFVALYLMAHIRGKVLILAPSVILCEQWRERVNQYAPQTDVTILTYASGKKAVKGEWTLVVFDEVQTLPADTFSRLAFLTTKYRIGLSASPWREDGRQYMITALSGFPCAIRWADLIRAGVLKRPRIVIATVPNEAAKTAYTRQLIERRKGGRVLIFCDYLKAGEQLANALDVEFVSGATPRKLQRVEENPICVVSRIADRGLDFPDLSLVIEWAFLGKSREQEAQRLGRLLHAQERGEHYLLFTPQEAEKFRPRIFGIEAELAGEVDLEFITIGNVTERRERTVVIHKPRRSVAQGPKPEPKAVQEKDHISTVMALKPIAVKIDAAKKSIGASTAPYVARVFRYCYDAPLSPAEIADGLGITGSVARSRISSSCKALFNAGLLDMEEGRYVVSQEEIKRAEAISKLVH